VTGYSQKTESLTRSLQHVGWLDAVENPVLAELRSSAATAEAAMGAIKQYSFLPGAIVEYLTIGVQRLSAWSAVATELSRNRAEELGSRTDGISHYEILETRLRLELGLDVADSRPSAATIRFIQSIRRELWRQRPPLVAGMIFALETTAIPELIVVASILNEAGRLMGKGRVVEIGPLPPDAASHTANYPAGSALTLSDFITLHVLDFEEGHKRGLEEAYEQYFDTEESLAEFEAGFQKVLLEMADWWNGLASELRTSLVSQPHRPERSGITNLTCVTL
jgi:hypothetical protein